MNKDTNIKIKSLIDKNVNNILLALTGIKYAKSLEPIKRLSNFNLNNVDNIIKSRY